MPASYAEQVPMGGRTPEITLDAYAAPGFSSWALSMSMSKVVQVRGVTGVDVGLGVGVVVGEGVYVGFKVGGFVGRGVTVGSDDLA